MAWSEQKNSVWDARWSSAGVPHAEERRASVPDERPYGRFFIPDETSRSLALADGTVFADLRPADARLYGQSQPKQPAVRSA